MKALDFALEYDQGGVSYLDALLRICQEAKGENILFVDEAIKTLQNSYNETIRAVKVKKIKAENYVKSIKKTHEVDFLGADRFIKKELCYSLSDVRESDTFTLNRTVLGHEVSIEFKVWQLNIALYRKAIGILIFKKGFWVCPF